MTTDWGNCYLDHYEKFLTQIASREVFTPHSPQHGFAIQVFGFDKVFSQCRVFASFGLSRYQEILKESAEVVMPVDAGWEKVPTILANVLFHILDKKMLLGRGVAIDGISRIAPEFCERYGKEAVYFTSPIFFPREFATVPCTGETGSIYLGVFISAAEMSYFSDHGADNLENVFKKNDVDPFVVARPSTL